MLSFLSLRRRRQESVIFPGNYAYQIPRDYLVQLAVKLLSSNRQRARPLRTRPHKRVTLIMVGFSTTEATIKSKNFRREELIVWKPTCFWQRALTAKQLLHGAKGKITANTHPESALGWVLIGSALGRSSTYTEPNRTGATLITVISFNCLQWSCFTPSSPF